LRPHLSLLSYTTVVYGMSALTLLFLTWLGGYSFLGYSPTVYLLFLLMALFPQLLGHSSYNYALAFLPAAYVSVAIISEPIGASALGLLVFGEVPALLTVAGSVLILTGVFIAGRRPTAR
jgi:drug/metabolite transporter (DMT)-like permease